MSHALSFAPEFFWGKGPRKQLKPSAKPTSVAQALLNLSDVEWAALARNFFGVEPADLAIETVVQQVIETDTCENLESPVAVYIDPEGWYSVLVYEEES